LQAVFSDSNTLLATQAVTPITVSPLYKQWHKTNQKATVPRFFNAKTIALLHQKEYKSGAQRPRAAKRTHLTIERNKSMLHTKMQPKQVAATQTPFLENAFFQSSEVSR